jgi:hypothetical protein
MITKMVYEKCNGCAKNNPNDGVRVRIGGDTPYGCYDNTDECTKPEFPEFESITNKNVRCVNCANARDMNESGNDTNPPYCYCAAGVFAGRVHLVVERDCNKFTEKKDKNPVLVKCRDCRYCLPPENIGNFHCNVAPDIDIRSITVDELHGCDDFVKREPEKSEPEKREPETGPDKKSCHTCNACVKDTWGTSCKKGLLTFCPDNEYCQWEPVPEKEPEKEQSWEWEADCGQCRFRHETTHHDAHGECLMCEKGNIVKDNHPERSTVLYNSYKDCPDYEKEWAWQADCGDCIYIKTITEDVKGTQKGRIAACKIPHVGGYCVKCVEVPPDYWYRIQRVDFHDCEGYTAPEPEKPNPVELKCDTCIHYPVQSDPKRVILCGEVCGADHEAYIPRSCGNCGHRPPNSVTNVCMYCTLRNMFIGGHETFLINQEYCDEWIPKSEEPAKSCETCGNRKPHEYGVGGTYCSIAEFPRCNGDKTWRSWTPKPEKEPEKPEIALPDGSERCEWDLVNNVLTFHFACRTCGKYTNRKYPLTTTAVVIGLSCKECEDNEEVIKEKIKENKEVTEMNKSEEKFPFTCPACGHGDDEQGNYCPECGVSVNEMIPQRRVEMMDNDYTWHPDPLMEQQIRDALHIPEKKERTRKAVRVKESKRKTFYLYVGFLMVDIAVAILSLVVGFWTNTIYMTVISIFGIWGLSSIVEFVDVPRVPTIDRLRAWKQARKDTRMAELERENEILRGDNKLAEVNLRGQEMITEEWKQTAANLTKQHEQDIKDITEERDAMVNTILTDRDANWIPLSNRIDDGWETSDFKDTGNYFEFTLKGYLKNGLKPPFKKNLVLFSRDALPENKDGDD